MRFKSIESILLRPGQFHNDLFPKLAGQLRPESRRRTGFVKPAQRPVYKIGGKIVYPEVCMGFGALRFADGAGDKALEQKLVDRYAFIITPEAQ
jgi:hypothetical protein